MRHFKIVWAACLACSLGLAAGCSDDKAKAVEAAMEYAPPGAVGVLHVDYKALVADVLAELRKHRDRLGGISEADLDQIAAAAAKMDSVDLFIAPGLPEPKVVGVVRTSLAPGDIMSLLQTLGAEPGTMTKGDNGRYHYTKTRVRLIFGSEADDLDSGIVLVAPPDVLTDEFVAKLGSDDNATLRDLLGEVDTSRPVWATVGLEFLPGESAPTRILASLDPRGDGSGGGTFVFRSEKHAEMSNKGILGRPGKPFPSLFSIERDGATLTMQVKGGSPFIPRALAVFFRTRQMAREAVSEVKLRQLSKAIVAYAAEYEGKMPPDLKAVARYLDNLDKALRSPLSKGKLPAGQSDYVYIPVGRLFDAAPETIMLYERPENHDGKGTMVAFTDGHVEQVDMARFKQLLKAARALSAKQTDPK